MTPDEIAAREMIQRATWPQTTLTAEQHAGNLARIRQLAALYPDAWRSVLLVVRQRATVPAELRAPLT